MADEWLTLPDLGDLLPWQHSGIKPNRAWVYAPDSQTLRRRWNKLIAAPGAQKDDLLKASRDRDSNTRPAGDPAVPGNPVPLSLQGPCTPRIERVAFRSFDRQFLILDQRVVDYPRSELWAVAGDPQIFLTTSHDQQITSGPALTFTTYVPDTHHFEGRGGQVIPLYRDPGNRRPNLAPGLAHCLSGRLGVTVTPEDLLAYIAAVAAHPGYTRRFRLDLRVPGVRIPLTASSALWREGVDLGRNVLQAHTYGRALHDPRAARPPEPPRLPRGRRPNVRASPTTLPAKVTYEPHAQEIRFGDGVIAQVPPEVWTYSVGDMNVIRKWFEYRLQNSRHVGPSSAPDVKRSSLDSDRAPEWGPQFADDLYDLLHVIGTLTSLEPVQNALLDSISETPIITVSDLKDSGVLPVPDFWNRPPGVRTAPTLIAVNDD
jgi:hypothetical protein